MKRGKMKKWMILTVTGLMMLALFTSCTGTASQEPQSTAPQEPQSAVSQTETAEPTKAEAPQSTVAPTKAAKQTQTYREAYAGKLADLRAEFGAPKGSFKGQKGVLFADLIDWDTDGTPEMMVLVHETMNDADGFRLHVYGAKDGEAVTLLNQELGSFYGNLGSFLYFALCKNAAGELMIRVDNSHEYADLKETYYTFSDGEVHAVGLSAQSSIGGWEGEGDDVRPADPDAYQIDGKTCSKEAFYAQRDAIMNNEIVGVWCQYIYDLRALDDFLSGRSDAYAGGALVKADTMENGSTPTPWLSDVLFTVGN